MECFAEVAEPAEKRKFDIWDEYENIIHAIRPEGTPTSEAIQEIQRYVDVPIVADPWMPCYNL